MASELSAPLTLKRARWILPETDRAAIDTLRAATGIPELAAAVLVQRGLLDVAQVRRFLEPSIEHLHDPFHMRDMDKAVARIERALRERETILLYGDYDVDGTVSIVILHTALRLLGVNAEFHVPHRLKEGYGMRAEVIEEAASRGIRLIISVDTGIRATTIVKQANELGIDVIVTDHHLPESELPPAVAVLNPHRPDCNYEEKDLCGAAVALKLIQALLSRSSFANKTQAKLLESFIKLAAIATVADIVPLTGENRVIVQRGLAGLQDVRNAGLRALIRVAGLTEGQSPTAQQVAFRIAPRINAAGRMASAQDVIELFLTDKEERAEELAQKLDALNRERQQTEAAIIDAIVKECESQPLREDCYGLVFSQPGWHLGVVGIVASRLVERFARPVFVLSDAANEGYLSGSGRSIPAFHLLDALESMNGLFEKYGGHRQAAGLTIHRDRIAEFRTRFEEFANRSLTAKDLCRQYPVDAIATLRQLTGPTVDGVFALGPFGFGNTAPLFCALQVRVKQLPTLYSDGKLAHVALEQDGKTCLFKAWHFADRLPLLQPGEVIDILFTIDEDPYSKARGYDPWSLCLKDVRAAEAP